LSGAQKSIGGFIMAFSIRNTKEEFVNDGNNLFEVTINKLHKDGYLTDEQFNEVKCTYIVDCVDRNGIPDRILNKLFPSNYSYTRRWMLYKVDD